MGPGNMEKLLSPDFGLMFWTILVFLLTVFVLGRAVWKPLIGALEDRERALKAEREAAEAARQAAEKLKADLEGDLAQIQQKAQEALAKAVQQGQKGREEIILAAQGEAKNLVEKGRRDLMGEKERLMGDLRREVADLSLLAAERLLKHSVDAKVQKEVLDDFYVELQKREGWQH